MDEIQFGEMRSDLRRLQQDVDDIKKHVNEVRDIMSQLKGANRLLILGGTVLTTIASGLAYFLGFFKGTNA